MLKSDSSLEEILNSKEYQELYKNLSTNNTLVNNLPEDQLKLVALIYHLGGESVFNDLSGILYKRRIPTIKEFLEEPRYFGEKGEYIYPKWKESLLEFFDEKSQRVEAIFSGSIGSGKTVIALVGHIYNTVRITSLRQPQLTLGSMPEKLLILQMISVTMDKANLALMSDFHANLKFCKLFEEVKTVSDFQDFNNSELTPYVFDGSSVTFPHNIKVLFGSRILHALSFDLYGAVLDEAEFRISGTEEAINVYTNLKERVRSRFLDSYKYTFISLISSAKYSTGVIAEYIKGLREDDPYTKYFAFPIWEIKEFDAYKKGHFYVMRGTKSHPSKILNDVEYLEQEEGKFVLPPNCAVIRVPEALRKDFERRLEEALQNLAGVQTYGSEFLFDDLTRLEHADLPGEITVELNLGTGQKLQDQLPKELFIKFNNSLRLARYPNAPRYIHLDLAETAEAGLSICHKELLDGEVKIVIDMAIRIITRTRIDLECILNFIIWLRKEVEVRFYKASADRFQSAYILQKLKTESITPDPKDCIILSMDKTPENYRQFSNAVSSDVVHIGKCPVLKFQLEAISEEEGKITTYRKKDLADSVAGCVVDALMTTKDVPIYSRNITQIIDVFKDQGVKLHQL